MKLALPVWQGRISPVFDVAGQLLLVELSNGREVARGERLVEESTDDERAKKLAELGVGTLICAGHLAVVGSDVGRLRNSRDCPAFAVASMKCSPHLWRVGWTRSVLPCPVVAGSVGRDIVEVVGGKDGPVSKSRRES